jgi:hypothetical protein
MHEPPNAKPEPQGTRRSETPLPDDLRAELHRLVTAHGVRGAAERAGVAPNTLSRAAAGFPVTAGTRALIRANLGREGRA